MEKNSWNWKELLKLALISFVIVVPFRLYVAQPFIVEGASMYPTFKDANYLVVDELTYHFSTPERGSVIVFRYPKNPTQRFIKRIIGLPGEIVSIKDGTVTITSSQYPEGLTLEQSYVTLPCTAVEHAKNGCVSDLTYTLGQDEYFVMGDNRFQSADSRMWGAVPKANLVGRPFIRFMPFGFFPGDFSTPSAN